MLSDKDYRNKVVENISDPSVKAFWTDEFAKYGDRYMQEAGAAIQNKIGQFVSNPLVRNIIGQAKSTFDIRKIMDEKKILIINLSKGRVGEANANLLGSMLITKIYLGAMSRADVSPSMLKEFAEFYLYVDEFQSFANESFADILSEARKYKLNFTIAHQYIEQMSEEVRRQSSVTLAQWLCFGSVHLMLKFWKRIFSDIYQRRFSQSWLCSNYLKTDD
jgi:type IV secretory pathway TraG/TraD family ATPase VirD4